MKNKHMRGAITMMSLAMLVAVLLMVASVCQRNELAGDLAAIRSELNESQAAWQQVAAEKEALQAERDEVSSALREAQTSLAESEAKNTELTAQLAQLETEEAQLSAQLAETGDALLQVKAEADQAQQLADRLNGAEQENTALKEELLRTLKAYAGYLTDRQNTVRKELSEMTTGASADPLRIEALWAEEQAIADRLSATNARIAAIEGQ